MSDFAEKVVLVTGGTRGIGRACAQAFADAGARVALCGRSEDTAKAAAEAVGGETRGFQADIGSPDSVDALVKKVEESLGPITILVNNAGVTRNQLLMRMKDEDWAAVLQTNLNGAFHCCRAVVRTMMKKRYGRIVNVSSVVGLHGQAAQSNYAASKAGLIGFTQALAHEVASRGITVNAVAPGYVTTDMTAELSDEVRQIIIGRIPLGREATTEEVAAAVKFLGSESASYITGTVLQVDGGLFI